MRLDSVTPGLEVKGRLGRQEGVEWVAFHVRGVVLPEDQERDLYIAGDRITLERLAGAETVVDDGWLVPGLVDVHTHPGAEEPGDPLDEELLRQHGLQHRDAGVTLLRVPGSAARLPAWFGQDDQLPRVFGAGPWLAAPGGYFPGWGRQVEVAALPELAVEEAAASGGWCKLIGDWGIGEGTEERQEPTVPPEVLSEVVRRVHAAGGRVAVHSQHGESGATAVAAASIRWSTACIWPPSCWTPWPGREPRWSRRCCRWPISPKYLPGIPLPSRCGRGWRLAGSVILA
jgi:hypothetical protein